MTGSGVAVQLSDLRRRFGVVLALDGPDLELAPGELVTLLGPSGCGKTTALRVLAGLEDADSGRVRVDGRDITTVLANRRDMGMVFQAYSLFPHLTARQNVEFGMRLRGRPAAERGRTAADLLDLVGIGTHADRYPHQLSGGQQQRVALARAPRLRAARAPRDRAEGAAAGGAAVGAGREGARAVARRDPPDPDRG